eukprot:9846233-Ditylum_brightwellii.AAC.1
MSNNKKKDIAYTISKYMHIDGGSSTTRSDPRPSLTSSTPLLLFSTRAMQRKMQRKGEGKTNNKIKI